MLGSVDTVVAKLADRDRVVVVEEQRLSAVQAGDLRHLVVGQVEVEDGEVFGHPLGSDRIGDDNDATLPGTNYYRQLTDSAGRGFGLPHKLRPDTVP